MGLISNRVRFSSPQPAGPMNIQRPFFDRGDSSHIIVSQRFRVLRSDYSPLEQGTPHPLFPEAQLIEETALRGGSQGIVTFDRVYANVPETRDDRETFAYRFIGIRSFDPDVRRMPRTLTVNSRVTHQFYRTDNPENIDVIQAQRYFVAVNGIEIDLDFVADLSAVFLETTPSATSYNTMINNQTEIVAEDSSITRYMGNIWQRSTRRVVAQ